MKKILICISICFTTLVALAQNKSAITQYEDFKLYRNSNVGVAKNIVKTLSLLQLADQLNQKQITNANYHLGRMFEEIDDPDNAIIYYEKSLLGEPNYEVIHRALGFIYLAKSTAAVTKINEAKANNDTEGNKKAFEAYKVLIIKALPHLEKYQACDPDDQTLNIITNLYKSLKDTKALETLNARLKEMSGKCVTLLDDE